MLAKYCATCSAFLCSRTTSELQKPKAMIEKKNPKIFFIQESHEILYHSPNEKVMYGHCTFIIRESQAMMISTRVGVPFASPYLNGAPIGSSRSCPSARFECCSKQPAGHGGSFGKLIREELPRMQREPRIKTNCPRYTQATGAVFTPRL